MPFRATGYRELEINYYYIAGCRNSQISAYLKYAQHRMTPGDSVSTEKI